MGSIGFSLISMNAVACSLFSRVFQPLWVPFFGEVTLDLNLAESSLDPQRKGEGTKLGGTSTF